MNSKKLTTIFLILTTSLLVVFLFPKISFAHPGRTASDGCHYCRTRCDYWGVPWNQRHCHSGGSAPAPTPVPTLPPTPKPTLTPLPTPTPSPTPTPTFSPSPTPSPTPTASPEVLGERDEKDNSGGSALGLIILSIPYIFWRAIKQQWPFHTRIEE